MIIETRGRSVGWLALLALIGALDVEGVRELLVLDRTSLPEGRIWALWTCHVLHASSAHLALNLVALFVLQQLFGAAFVGRSWWIAALAIAPAVSVGVLLTADYDYYLGLSGLLHGLWALGAIRSIRDKPWLAVGTLLLLLGKVAREQLAGPEAALSGFIGIAVATEAHAWGVVSGLVIAAALGGVESALERRESSETR